MCASYLMKRHMRIDTNGEAGYRNIGVGFVHRKFSLIFPFYIVGRSPVYVYKCYTIIKLT